MKIHLAILIIAIYAFYLPKFIHAQQQAFDANIEAKIQLVENNLVGKFVTQFDTAWNLQERMSYHNVPGLSIAVINDFKVEWYRSYGYANLPDKQPVDENTLFQAASISKSINALGIMKAVEMGKLELNQDINTYLTTWQFPYDDLSNGQKITLANLLSHTAGLSIHGFPGYTKTDPLPTLIEVINGTGPANTEAVRSQFEPGTKFQYSGGGTTISQLVLSNVIEQPYHEWMQKHILDPLGMTSSTYQQPPQKPQSLLASGHRSNGDPVEGNYHIYPEQAAAGLWTNPKELSQFIIEIQKALNGTSNTVLKQATTQKMLTPLLEERDAGLGVFVEKRGGLQFFNHSGANEGFRCKYYGSLTHGKGVVVMVNSDNGAVVGELINSVAKVYKWPGFYTPEQIEVADLSDAQLQTCVGIYQMGPGFTVNISQEGKLLKALPVGESAMLLYPKDEKHFQLIAMNAQVEFIASEDGLIEKLILHRRNGKMELSKVK